MKTCFEDHPRITNRSGVMHTLAWSMDQQQVLHLTLTPEPEWLREWM